MNGTRPLSQLVDVPWGELGHAYGSAEDVPDLVRAVAAGEGDAEHDLWCRILHQGNLYDATPEALPFLLGLLADRSCSARPLLADWLTDLSAAFEEPPGHPVVVGVRTALLAGLDAVATLLDDPDPELRSEVAGCLSRFDDPGGRPFALLRARWPDEDDAGIRADLLMSLATLARGAVQVEQVEELLESAERTAAASARCRLDPGHARARAVLLELLPEGGEGSPWWGVGTALLCCELLAARPGWLHDGATFEAILETVLAHRGFVAEGVLRLLLRGLFPGGAVPGLASELDESARRTMEALSVAPDFFERPLGTGRLVETTGAPMRALSLPSDGPGLRRWLEGAPRIECVAPGIRELMQRDRS